ncbi:MAG: DUF342 domain-containing protein [Clostridiaceae bacterium]|nr:DUF342 domain-containing protein [Clostridiaceae bacterium]
MTLLYKNDFIEILREKNQFYINSLSKGYSMEMFNEVLKSFPMIKVTSFMTIRNVIYNAPRGPEPFGEERERISLKVSDDKLKAYMTLYVYDEELKAENRLELVKEILSALTKEGIVFGINTKLLAGPLESGVEYVIAEGIPPVNGTDAEVKMYEIAELRPKVIDENNVNHYELNLINHVKAGDWLGERKDPTPGTPGKSVTGKVIPAIPGRNIPLLYDRKSVKEIYENGVTTLISRKNGAVYYRGDTIGVYDYLEIKGDIDFSTGNIDFDGYMSVKGTVEDNFSVIASNDIEILGEYGIGAADKISSREGNIYIKGGIAGRNKAVVRCKKNLYVKFLSDITVECEGNVYVGFYCMNSNVRAKQLIVESPKGRIIGGKIDVDIKVSAAEIGNKSESRTFIKVRGFDRNELKLELDRTMQELEENKKEIVRIRQSLQVYSNVGTSNLTKEQFEEYEDLKNSYAERKDMIKELEFKCKSINEYLKTPGEGAVIAKTRIYPKVRIEIKNRKEEVTQSSPMITYYYKDNEIKTM